MFLNTFSKLLQILSLLFLSFFMTPQHAKAVHWTVTGPGVTDLKVHANKVIFSYDLDVSRTFGTFEWTLTGHSFVPDTHVFNWDYDGSHDRSQKSTVLTAPDHTLVSARSGRGVFLYEGRGLTIRNDRTDNFVFRMTARNDDATKALSGTLEVSMVPVPAAFLPFAVTLGLAGFAANRRRSLLRNNP